jgi:SET domain-containing protein
VISNYCILQPDHRFPQFIHIPLKIWAKVQKTISKIWNGMTMCGGAAQRLCVLVQQLIKLPVMILPSLVIAPTMRKGRGVFTTLAIERGTVIEISPVIVMSKEDRVLLDQTLLHDYIFEWGHDPKQCCMALGYIPLYNHSYHSNCVYEMDYEQDLISIRTVRFIQPGEELFINYNGDWNNQAPVWFDAKQD